MTWEKVAVVVRSQCHDRTWIGHVQYATFEDTPAGPLGLVKKASEEMALEPGDRHRWRHSVDEDCWTLEIEEKT